MIQKKNDIASASAGRTGGVRGWFARYARTKVHARLARIRWGTLCVKDAYGCVSFGQGGDDACCAEIHVRDMRFYTSLALRGSVGAGESYMRGEWTGSSLTDVVRIMARNRAIVLGMEKGTASFSLYAKRFYHWLRRNTPTGSKRNIQAHYDLSNDFFALFLDASMMYSSAIYTREDMTLEEASYEKCDRLCRKLRLTPKDHVIEIGTGWGGFAIHAAERYGCRVTTTTISEQQYRYACTRVAEKGLTSLVQVVKKDYRELDGVYDKLVSIEMIEAVGHQYMPVYFSTINRLLKDDGMCALQAIIIDDRAYEGAVHRVDFIKRYIFPGSCIPSLTSILGTVTRVTDMRLFHCEDITPHYARTLREWRQRFFAHEGAVRALGYDESFIRMWEYYLCYCEGGFMERVIGDVQLVFCKPLCRCDPLLGALAHGDEERK